MTTLPKSIQPEELLKAEFPGDLTLAEVLPIVMASEAVATIKKHSRYPDRVRIRFLGEGGMEAWGTMTIRKMQQLVKAGSLRIVIDDGEGGELVS